MPGQPFPFIERVNAVSTAEPWRWLAAGWEDLRAARMKSVACSIPFVLAGYAVTFGLYQAGLHYLIWPALSGFFLLAPAFAVGYYEASRAREAGEMVRLGAMLGAWRRNASRVFGAGLTLCFFMILWLRSAALIYAINFPHGMISIQSILNQTFFSRSSPSVRWSGPSLPSPPSCSARSRCRWCSASAPTCCRRSSYRRRR